MENKIGYAVISTAEYREIIEDNHNKEECIRELNIVNKEETKIKRKLEEYFFKRIAKNEKYHLENIREFVPTDYHYQVLFNCFLGIGIDNVQYIHLNIMTIKKRFDDGDFNEEE